MSRTKKVWLSVDFDYFVREDVMWGMSHQESPLYRDMLWPMRTMGMLNLVEETDPETYAQPKPRDFWSTLIDLGYVLNPKVIVVADSHLFAYTTFVGLPDAGEHRLLHFDAHHDLGYWKAKDTKRILAKNRVECGSWMRFLLEEHRDLDVSLVYPEWKGLSEVEHPTGDWLTNPQLKDRIKYGVYGAMDLKCDPPVEVDVIYICRSGSWTPPWLDDDFIAMVRELENGTHVTAMTPFIDEDGCDPMIPRGFTREHALEQHAMFKAHQAELDKLRQMKV